MPISYSYYKFYAKQLFYCNINHCYLDNLL